MSAGRNKNSRTADRKGKCHKAAVRKAIRRQGLTHLRKAKRAKRSMYRLKNRLENSTGKALIVGEVKLKKLKTRVYNLHKKSKHLREDAQNV